MSPVRLPMRSTWTGTLSVLQYSSSLVPRKSVRKEKGKFFECQQGLTFMCPMHLGIVYPGSARRNVSLWMFDFAKHGRL